MDSFFTENRIAHLQRAGCLSFGTALCLLEGKSERTKSALFHAVCKAARQKNAPYTLLRRTLCADMPCALFLERENRLLLDADYFHLTRVCDVPSGNPAVLLQTEQCFSEPPGSACKALTAQRAHLLAEARAYRSAAARTAAHSVALLTPYLNKGRLLNYILRFTERSVGVSRVLSRDGKIDAAGSLTGFSPWGLQTLYAPFLKPDMQVILLKDRIGAAAPLLLRGLSAAFCAYGYTVRLYFSPLTSAPAHLLVPQLHLAFFTENAQQPYPHTADRILTANRFLPLTAILDALPELRLDCNLREEFLDECIFALLQAAEMQSALERLRRPRFCPSRYAVFERTVCAFLLDT